MQQHRFVKEEMGWFIDLPEYIAGGGAKADLQMVSGADTMLDIAAVDSNAVTLQLDERPFAGADELLLTDLCDPILGGGMYHLKSFEGREVSQEMWLCAVTEFVFGGMPPKIYIKRVSSE